MPPSPSPSSSPSPSRRRFLAFSGSSLAFPPFLLASASSCSRAAAPPSLDSTLAELEKSLPEWMAQLKVPGASVALVKDAKIVWTRTFGLRNKEKNEPIVPETVFEAASLSKPTFGYAALKLVESGKLSLDAPLSDYLPEPFIANEPRLAAITARRVLTHTSGLPHGRNENEPLALKSAPGEKFAYSATGFDYLQKVAAQLTGKSLEDFMQETVLEPFGMASSRFGWRKDFASRLASGYDPTGKPGQTFNERYRAADDAWRKSLAEKIPELTYPSAAAGMISTPDDFARFLIEIMAPANRSSAHLSPELTAEMLRPQAEVSKAISWGLGWGVQHTKEGDTFWHWGNWGCFQHFAAGFKDRPDAIVIMTNSGNGLRLSAKITPVALGLDIRPLRPLIL